MLKLLVKCGSDLDGLFRLGDLRLKLLHVACSHASPSIVSYLLTREEDEISALNQTIGETGSTCMHMAAQGGKPEVLELLVKEGAYLCAVNKVRDTPLHISIRRGHEEFSLALIRAFVDHKYEAVEVDVENTNDFMTPYCVAMYMKQYKVAELLKTNGLADLRCENFHRKRL
jgi:ankyrin repeat protein